MAAGEKGQQSKRRLSDEKSAIPMLITTSRPWKPLHTAAVASQEAARRRSATPEQLIPEPPRRTAEISRLRRQHQTRRRGERTRRVSPLYTKSNTPTNTPTIRQTPPRPPDILPLRPRQALRHLARHRRRRDGFLRGEDYG